MRPLEWLKFNPLTTINFGKEVKRQELSFIADGNANLCTLEKSLEVSYKAKHTVTI